MTEYDEALPIEDYLLLNQDNLVRWDEMALASSGAYVTSGNFTFSLQDSDYATVATGTGAYYGTNGRWHVTISKSDVLDTALTPGGVYFLKLAADNGSGVDGGRRIKMKAVYQGKK